MYARGVSGDYFRFESWSKTISATINNVIFIPNFVLRKNNRILINFMHFQLTDSRLRYFLTSHYTPLKQIEYTL